MHEEMQEYRIILTWEAIYDVTDIAYHRRILFTDFFSQSLLNSRSSLYFRYKLYTSRGYSIHKRSFPPSIIFYIIMEETKEIHILRVLRHERDWENILLQRSTYTYPE